MIYQQEWEQRGRRYGLQSVMSTRWTEQQCEEATAGLKRAVFAMLGDVHGCRVLDFGCGIGRFSVEFAQRGASVVSVDLSMNMLRRAQASFSTDHLTKPDLINAIAPSFPLASEQFDVVFETTVLQHIVQDKQFTDTLDGLKRLARENGRIFLCGQMNDSATRTISPFTVERTVDQYQGAMAPWRLVQRGAFLCVTDPYTLTLWQRG